MNQSNAAGRKIKIVLEISLENCSQQATSERSNKVTSMHACFDDEQRVLLQPGIANQYDEMTVNDILDQLELINQLNNSQPSTSTSQLRRERASAPIMAMVRPQVRAATVRPIVPQPPPQRDDVEEEDDNDNDADVPQPFTVAQRAFFAARRRERERGGGGERESVFERIRQFQEHNISIETVALRAKALLESRRQQRN